MDGVKHENTRPCPNVARYFYLKFTQINLKVNFSLTQIFQNQLKLFYNTYDWPTNPYTKCKRYKHLAFGCKIQTKIHEYEKLPMYLVWGLVSSTRYGMKVHIIIK